MNNPQYAKKRYKEFLILRKCLRCKSKISESSRYPLCDECKKKNGQAEQVRKAKRLASGICFKCGKRPYAENHRTCEDCRLKMSASREKTIKAHWKNYIWFSVKNSALKRGIEFNILKTDIPDMPEFCPLLEIRLEIAKGRVKANSPTIDRIDSSKGYIKGNIWVISHKANSIKSNATPEEINLLAKNLNDALRKF